MKQKSRLGLRSLFAAAALLTAVQPAAQAAELNYTVDNLGSGRYIVDFYTSADIGFGAGSWVYGARPVVAPVLTSNITSTTQSGSINFLNYRNGALVQTSTGVAATIYGSVYQDGVSINALFGAAIFGVVTVPNVSVAVSGVNSTVSYSLYNPNSYDAVLNVSGSTITATPGRDAIHADAYVNLTLNLSGSNAINGAVAATQINANSGATTFNGNVGGNVYVGTDVGLNFTTRANSIVGDISSWNGANFGSGQNLTFRGSNTVNGAINLGYASSIDLRGAGVIFNGSTYASDTNFRTAGSLTLGDSVQLGSNVHFLGNNATLTIGDSADVDGSVDTSSSQSGTLNFAGRGQVYGDVGGAGSLSSVNVLSSADAAIYGLTKTVNVDFAAAGVLSMVGGLDTRHADGLTLGSLSFNNNAGEAQFGQIGSVSSIEVRALITTDTNTNGTLKFLGGSADVYGSVGSASYELALLDVGGEHSNTGLDSAYSAASVVIHTNTFVHNTLLNGNASYLGLASGFNITGANISSSFDGQGTFDLMGGTQVATFSGVIGDVGNRIGTVNGGHAVGDSSTFLGNVTAVNIHAYDGAAYFRQGVAVVNASVGAGTIDFNADSGTTSISNRFSFTGAGVANFHQGVTVGTLTFDGYAGTVNIAAGKNLIGNIRNFDLISSSADGTLNFLGGTSLLDGNVGSGGGNASIALLNVGKDAVSTLTVSGDIYSNEVRLSNGSTLIAQGNITGDVTTTTTGTGSLNLTAGNQTVSGNVGTASAHLAAATVGAAGTTTTLNGSAPTAGMSYINQVTFAGNGTLLLNGANGGAAIGGLVGTVNFTSGGTGTIQVGDGVNLTFGASGIVLQNANAAHLEFLGDATVTGQIGAPAVGGVLATSTPRDIYAGANGAVVNFGSNVYVSSTTFHVVGTGTVNFAGDLVGPLVYEDNGIVNFNDTKRVVGVVTTTADDQGILNYKGSTVLAGQIGTSLLRLQSVNFHTATTQAASAQSIGYDIYSVSTTFGNTGTVSGSPTTTVVTLTGDVHLGTGVSLADASTTLYTSGAQTLNGTSVDFTHTKNADGTLSIATVTHSVVDNNLATNNGTLGFAIAASPFSTVGGSNGLVNVDLTKSSRITAGSLTMSGAERIQVSFLGSLKNNVSYTLIDAASGATSAQAGTLLDNSFTIDTTMARVNGDLVITTHRDANTYVTKSATLGSRSDNLAIRLGTLAAAGTGYSASLQTVFDKLDLDQWGYGNTAANLANQLNRLTPAGDGAAFKASTGLTSQAVGTILDGSTDISTMTATGNDYWVRAFGGHSSQKTGGEYADFTVNGGGAVVGTDRQIGRSVLGFALGYGQSTASSDGSRAGDKTKVDSTVGAIYFRTPVGSCFVNAIVDVAKHATKTDRLSAVGARAQGDFSANEFGGELQFGRRFDLADDKKTALTPVLAIEHARYHQGAYSETGAGDIGLNVGAQSYSQSAASFSLRYSKEVEKAEGIASSFTASLGYKHLLSTPTFDNDVSFVGDSQTYAVGGWHDTTKGSIVGGISYNYNPRKGVTYSLQYDGETKSGFSQHTLGVRATWAY